MATKYIHGTHPEEQKRLSLLNEILNERCLRELSLTYEKRVLDVGSGLGQYTKRIAESLKTGGVVVGIEKSPDQLKVARSIAPPSNASLEFREGSAYELPLEPTEFGTFDLVHSRFLLEHLEDPLKAVKEMVRAAKPGGRIVLEDDDHYTLRLWPEPPGFKEIWPAYIAVLAKNNTDPFVGRRLVELLYQAGAEPVRNTFVFFGSCAGQADFEHFVDNLAGILIGTREQLVIGEQIGEDAFVRFLSELDIWKRRKDAAFWYGLSWVEGRASIKE